VLDQVGQLVAITDHPAGFGSVERQSPADNLKQLTGGPVDRDVGIAAIVGEDQWSVRSPE
jgi:hypothetical protein